MAPEMVLLQLLDLPAFVLAFFALYWSLQLGCLTYQVRFASPGRRHDAFEW